MDLQLITKLIDLAILEDIGDGDHSSLSCIPQQAQGKVQLMLKQEGIIAGVEISKIIFNRIDPEIAVNTLIPDGTHVKPKDIVFTATGRVHSLLQAERIVLNTMQRMSGIATQTDIYVKRIEGTRAKILDTRKTTPGMRIFDKIAVKIGGGENHRMGLFDLIMLKDNHIDFAGGIENAVKNAQQYLLQKGKNLGIEVETRSLGDIEKVLAVGGVQRIMFDNFTPELTHQAVKLVNGRVETESSGGITLATIREYAETGVDYISVGALTHQVKSLDMNLKKV
ncbi:MAG: carboxylating nicotinate-nucleotide diphosphorylase [Bacteroidales bacterium]|nr:carboxylating nicotinate-nucleotide diphosphorylase [Bacteroidales bacterium]MBN2748156.1 carboxylating nicotinate-nucleotide diphosphorylase [Bacteroidales bacterium]